MKKFLLSMALVLCTIGAMAQNEVEFTFNRTAGTVTAKVNGTVNENITATIAASGDFLTSNNAANDSILVINNNTSEATEATPNKYTLTISGLDANYAFNRVVVGGVAVNSTGAWQGTSVVRDRYFKIGYGETSDNLTTTDAELARICDNMHCNGNPTDNVFKVDGATASGNLVVEVQIYTDGGQGCFYGLTSITLQEVYVEPGKFYSVRLTPTMSTTDSRAGAVMSTDASAGLYCLANYSGASNEIFTFEKSDGKMYMKSVHTNTYISTVGGSQTKVMIGAENIADAKSVTLGKLGTTTVDGEKIYLISITPEGGAMLNCGGKPGNVVAYNNSDAAKASSWYAVEVENFSHTLNVTDAEWATIVLGFNATIPTADGFKAYKIASEEDGYVTLEEVTGVLQANVPVLVNAPAGNYNFAYTTDEATVTESGLQGTLYNKDITVAGAYVLGLIDGEAGFGLATTTGKAEGTFTNNANKAYFVPTNTLASAASYSFRFGEGTTGVEKVEIRNEKSEIYDLTGRRVEAITAPGIYIVGGKKVLVK